MGVKLQHFSMELNLGRVAGKDNVVAHKFGIR